MLAATDTLGFISAPAYWTPAQILVAIRTAPPTLNPNADPAACSTVMVSVSPPFEGSVSDAVNVLAPVNAPTLAEISIRGCACERDCAAAGLVAPIAQPSTVTQTVSRFTCVMNNDPLRMDVAAFNGGPPQSSPG